jgi:SPX domain protein involved in polyphosphate accumulation
MEMEMFILRHLPVAYYLWSMGRGKNFTVQKDRQGTRACFDALKAV